MIEKDRYNLALELLIKKGKKNKIYQFFSKKDKNKQFDLLIENQTHKQFESQYNGEQIFAFYKSIKNFQSLEPATLTKPQKRYLFI